VADPPGPGEGRPRVGERPQGLRDRRRRPTTPSATSRSCTCPASGYDGICGVSPIRAARQSIGLALAAEEYGAKLFGSGSLATGILQTEQRLTQTQADALEALEGEARRPQNAHETIVLDSGAKFQQLTIPPEDAQFLESRRFQIVEVCRWFGIPPFLMFETEKSTSAGAPASSSRRSAGSVRPAARADRGRAAGHQACSSRSRSTPATPRGPAPRRLRGARRVLPSMWNLGALSTNEIRAYEEQAPVEGGDVRYRPLNMGELGTTDATAAAPRPRRCRPMPRPEQATGPIYRFHGRNRARRRRAHSRPSRPRTSCQPRTASPRCGSTTRSTPGAATGASRPRSSPRRSTPCPDDTTEIRLHINSPGGEVYEGLAILNLLRNHKAHVVAVVDGLAASAASFIAAGADEVVMGRNTS
jgi:hypothetical protein